jgi:hypothetical protein
MPTLEEFKTKVVIHAEKVAKVRDQLQTEEATKTALILPFIGLLGYDVTDPSEVIPEHPADFSDKYKNRVDFAIKRNNIPVIAIECKSVGSIKKEDRGQLRSYFNAAKTIKIGILTDGVAFEFFVDSNDPNIMDDEPYLTIDFGAKASLSDHALGGLYTLSKGAFDPDSIADNAKRSIAYHAFYRYLADQFADPNPKFTRLLLEENGFKHIRTTALDGYRAITRDAFRDVFNHHVMRSLDIAGAKPAPTPDASASVSPEPSSVPSGVVTTEIELAAFEAIRRRLAFLVAGDTGLYDAIARVAYHDYQGKMVVFYGGEKKGRLVEIFEGKDGAIRFVVTDGSDSSPVTALSDVDIRLKALFAKRVADVK